MINKPFLNEDREKMRLLNINVNDPNSNVLPIIYVAYYYISIIAIGLKYFANYRDFKGG